MTAMPMPQATRAVDAAATRTGGHPVVHPRRELAFRGLRGGVPLLYRPEPQRAHATRGAPLPGLHDCLPALQQCHRPPGGPGAREPRDSQIPGSLACHHSPRRRVSRRHCARVARADHRAPLDHPHQPVRLDLLRARWTPCFARDRGHADAAHRGAIRTSPAACDPTHAERIDVISVYWHFVDVVWIVVVTVVYIIGR